MSKMIEQTKIDIKNSMLDDINEILTQGIKEEKVFLGDIMDVISVGSELLNYHFVLLDEE